MSQQEAIEKLLQKIPKTTTVESAVEGMLSYATELTGTLIGREGESIIVRVGTSLVYVDTNDIMHVAESQSREATRSEDVEVTLRLQPDAKLRVVQVVDVSKYASRIGMKPLIYDLPSAAPAFAVPAQHLSEQQGAWLHKVGLGDFPGRTAGTPTFYLTSSPTANTTTTSANYSTATQNADSNIDSQADTTTDYSTDYLSDVD